MVIRIHEGTKMTSQGTSGVYEYDNQTLPALIFIDTDEKIYDVHYRYDDIDLAKICSDYKLDYEDIQHRIRSFNPGIHTVMIDLPRYREARPHTNEEWVPDAEMRLFGL